MNERLSRAQVTNRVDRVKNLARPKRSGTRRDPRSRPNTTRPTRPARALARITASGDRLGPVANGHRTADPVEHHRHRHDRQPGGESPPGASLVESRRSPLGRVRRRRAEWRGPRSPSAIMIV